MVCRHLRFLVLPLLLVLLTSTAQAEGASENALTILVGVNRKYRTIQEAFEYASRIGTYVRIEVESDALEHPGAIDIRKAMAIAREEDGYFPVVKGPITAQANSVTLHGLSVHAVNVPIAVCFGGRHEATFINVGDVLVKYEQPHTNPWRMAGIYANGVNRGRITLSPAGRVQVTAVAAGATVGAGIWVANGASWWVIQ